jgi:hypothetical protein
MITLPGGTMASESTSPESDPQSSAGAYHVLRRLGEARDGLLVAVAITYGLGFLVVSFYSYREGLGLLPLLQAQYFAAGLLPAVLITLTYLAYRWTEGLVARVLGALKRTPRFLLDVISGTASSVLGALSWNREGTWVVIVPAVLVAGVTGVALLSRVRHSAIKGGAQLVSVAVLALACASLSTVYAIRVYPGIPQELGGVRAESARLDLVTEAMSESTLTRMVDYRTDAKVVRSRELKVLFVADDFLLFRLPGDRRLYSLRTADTAKAIIWSAPSTAEH